MEVPVSTQDASLQVISGSAICDFSALSSASLEGLPVKPSVIPPLPMLLSWDQHSQKGDAIDYRCFTIQGSSDDAPDLNALLARLETRMEEWVTRLERRLDVVQEKCFHGRRPSASAVAATNEARFASEPLNSMNLGSHSTSLGSFGEGGKGDFWDDAVTKRKRAMGLPLTNVSRRPSVISVGSQSSATSDLVSAVAVLAKFETSDKGEARTTSKDSCPSEADKKEVQEETAANGQGQNVLKECGSGFFDEERIESSSKIERVGIGNEASDTMEERVSRHSTLSAKRFQEQRQTSLEESLTRRLSHMNSGDDGNGLLCVKQYVNTEAFDIFVTACVLLNALLVGAQVQYDAVHTNHSMVQVFQYGEYVFTAIFTIELILRVFASGKSFCQGGECGWAWFDVTLVAVSLLDVSLVVIFGVEGLPGSGAFLGKMLRVIRVARLMRILRTLRWLRDLRIMATMIVNSMLSLVWLMCILIVIIYMFAIVLTQGASDYLKSLDCVLDALEPDENTLAILKYHGSLFETMFTLFKAMTFGLNWGDMADLMETIGWPYIIVVVAYVILTGFAVVNIVTGVFVDGAIELSRKDREMVVEKRKAARQEQAAQLLQLLQEIDANGDGVVTAEEFYNGLSNPRTREFLDAFEVDTTDAQSLYTLLDRNGDGAVDIVEFVEGMQRLRGEAKSSDIHILMLQNRKLLRICSDFMHALRAHLAGEPCPIDDRTSNCVFSRSNTNEII